MKAKTKSVVAQPTLLVDSEVVRQIRQHARSSTKAEICGVLIGQDRDQRIEVAASIEGQNAEEAGAHVTFTQDTWEHIYAVKDKKFPNERIVGWYHSHPGFGVFLSEHDTFIHKNFFSSPGQVAWVFDPHSDEEGCFGWVDGQIERLTRISVVDKRGGELAEAASRPEPLVAGKGVDKGENGRDSENTEQEVSRPLAKAGKLRVRHLELEEQSSGSEVSLEQLVTRVFFYIAVLVLGFAISWYFFPRTVLELVPVDPMTGLPLDPRMRQLVLEEQEKERKDRAQDSGKNSPSSSAPNGTPDQNKK